MKLDTTYNTTYNSTKNGPIIFKAYGKDGNAGELEYDEENVINFETEWTMPNDNIRIEIWNRENVSISSRCFQSCTNLSNYADISSSWK